MMMLKWARLQLLYWMVPLITSLHCKEILSNGPGYEVSYLLTSNLPNMPSKPDKLKVAGPKKTQ